MSSKVADRYTGGGEQREARADATPQRDRIGGRRADRALGSEDVTREAKAGLGKLPSTTPIQQRPQRS